MLLLAVSTGCAGNAVFWNDPPPLRLKPHELDEARRDRLRDLSHVGLKRARAAVNSGQRVRWYGQAGIAQYRLQSGRVPLDVDLLMDDPTGMIAMDTVNDANETERRHHPHLFDCTSWYRRINAQKASAVHSAWAAHCQFRIGELRTDVFRNVKFARSFDGTMPRRLRARLKALNRAVDAYKQAQRIALRANERAVIVASSARMVILLSEMARDIARVPVPEVYRNAPKIAAALVAKQRQIAVRFGDKARELLGQMNKVARALRREDDPWAKAARKAVLAAPRQSNAEVFGAATGGPSTRPRPGGP